MPTHRFPILLCHDSAGFHSARVVDGPRAAGYAATSADALAQVRKYLEWHYRRNPLQAGPDFLEPQLTVFRVEVRPEHRADDRVYPCEAVLPLRVHCVHGVQESGMRVACLPLLDVQFFYHDADQLKPLVQRYAALELEGKSPGELARHLPPAAVELSEVVVRVKQKDPGHAAATAPPALGQVAEALGDRAARTQFTRAWERDAVVAEVVKKLRDERANILLIGEPGVGKTTVLVSAVQDLERESKQRLFWLTSAGRIIAGMRYLGMWEERVEQVIAELGRFAGYLCADRLLDLLRLGGTDASDSIAAFLAPFVQRGELKMVGEATPAELDACRRLLPGFADLFQIVHVPPFTRPQAVAVLDRVATSITQNGQVTGAPGTVDRIYHLFRRFAPYTVFPGKAVAFTRQLFERTKRAVAEAQSARLHAGGPTAPRVPQVTPDDVTKLFVEQTGLPAMFLRDEVTLDRDEVIARFRDDVIDQEDACLAAANLVVQFKAGLNDPHRPLGVLLFCGPTGVGKTALARALARFFFGAGPHAASRGTEDRLIRLDMSEYAGFDAVERLLGPPQGEPSALVRKIRQQPFSVVLLDEIEKAGPEVFDVLLGVFDEGRLADRFGRVTSFRSAVIVCTSNLGADRQRSLGFGPNLGPRYADEARAFFRPEFFNRLDAVVTFRPLQPETIRAITRKELTDLGRREGLERAGLKLAPTVRLVEFLAAEGFDARYGARPLQRTIERLVVAPLAKWLLARPALRGATVAIDVGADGVVRIGE